MEIEHVVTSAAEKALEKELSVYSSRLREEAVKGAFSSRGKPVEVTASDVKRAAESLTTLHTDAIKSRYRSTYRLLTSYLWAGIGISALALLLMAVAAFFPLELPLSSKLVGTLGVMGLFLVAFSGAMLLYFNKRLSSIRRSSD